MKLTKRYGHYSLGEITEVAKFPSVYQETNIDSTGAKAFGYFVMGSSAAGLAIAAKNAVLPFLTTLGAAADVVAMANIEVDIGTLPVGEAVTVKWRGKPLFIRHRTAAEIEAAEAVPMTSLIDPQLDSERVRGPPNILVLLGICTHLGCVPLNGAGNYNGWFCPCHGSHYDTSGRIRAGPAPRNLEVPPYYYLDDTHLLVGLNSAP
jgi:ubiquinol-cytochrome c reductase iron-sulfur subunit